MTGKTHLAFGVAITLLAMEPMTFPELCICVGSAAVGAVISDIDIRSSDAHKKADRLMLLLLLVVPILCFVEYKWRLGFIKYFGKIENVPKVLGGLLVFLVVCIMGEKTPHRSFMHSLLAVCLLGGSLYFVYPKIAPSFMVAMLSHIALDIFNYKNVKVMYPLKWGSCFSLCKADGLANKLIFYTSSIAVIGELTYLGGKIFHLL